MTSTIIRIKTSTNLCEVAYQLLFPFTGSRDKRLTGNEGSKQAETKRLTGREGSGQGNEAPKVFVQFHQNRASLLAHILRDGDYCNSGTS